MNDVLKQRLVGALILLALGVVFWPIIFVEPGERRGGEEVQVPPRPQVDTTPVAPPDLAGLRTSPKIEKEPEPVAEEPTREILTLVPGDPVTSDDDSADAEPERAAQPAPEPEPKPVADAPKTRSEPPVKPALDADGIPISWILRVASVSNAERADQLRKELLGMGHKAYVKKVKSGERTLYRVYVGPKVEKSRLEGIQGEINQRFGVETLITRYYP